jgi:putative selenate reductase
MCNECGNCATFCPHEGKPYTDKLTVFCCGEDFAESKNSGFLKTGNDMFKLRLEDKSVVNYRKGEKSPGEKIPKEWIAAIDTVCSQYNYLLV